MTRKPDILERNDRQGILVVDDRQLISDLTTAYFHDRGVFRVVASAWDEFSAIDLVSQHRPHALLINAGLRNRGAFRVLRHLRMVGLVARSVMLDDAVYVARLREALRLGVIAYHTLHDSLNTLSNALSLVLAGRSSFSADIAVNLISTEDGPRLAPRFRHTPLETLSQRELDVLMLVAQGLTVNECAEQLDLSPSTVDNHKTRMMRKLRLHRTVDLVRVAIHEGLVPS